MDRQRQLERLADAAERLEGEVAKLREEVAALAAGDPAEPEAPAAAESDPVPEEARLLALSMAFDGVSRDEAAQRLRDEFSLEDVEELLDEAYAHAAS